MNISGQKGKPGHANISAPVEIAWIDSSYQWGGSTLYASFSSVTELVMAVVEVVVVVIVDICMAKGDEGGRKRLGASKGWRDG